MSVKHIKGDLLKLADGGQFDVIIHGCNCFNVMGSGIAFAIAQRWPDAAAIDKATERGDKDKLGRYTKAIVNIDARHMPLTVINLYTQYDTSSRGEDVFEYEAFMKGLKSIKLAYPRLRIGMPKIGCGLAGGDERLIMAIIEHVFKNGDVTVVEYQK